MKIFKTYIAVVFAILWIGLLVGCNQTEKTFTEKLDEFIYDIEYVEGFSLVKFAKEDREVNVRLNEAFNNLSLEEKHTFMRDELADKIRRAYSNFLRQDKNYEKLKASPLTRGHIVVSATCSDKNYQYGIIESVYNNLLKEAPLKYIALFVDYDGERYEYVNRTEEKEHLDKISKEIQHTNKYGTPKTICAYSSCTSYIASSGDTQFCTKHSNKCLECGAYIDDDAAWCIACIEKELKRN